MYKLLIVDDEPHIRSGLQHIIEWEIYGIELINIAEDGLKAFSIIQKDHPDIVLVDITMPNMNGLDLIEQCNQLPHPPKFIILTGYNDFKYVQKAIKLGATDYLLKPVDQDELANTISSCIKSLDDFYERNTLFNESLPALRNDLLLRLINNQIDIQEFQKKSSIIDISLKNKPMRVGIFLLQEDKEQSIHSILDIIKTSEQILSQATPCYVITDNGQNILVIFKNTEDYSESYLTEHMTTCANMLSQKLGLSFFSTLGQEVFSIYDLHVSYEDSISKMEKKIILGENAIEIFQANSENIQMNYVDFLACLDSNDANKIKNYLYSFYQQLITREKEKSILKYHLIDLTSYILHQKYMNAYFGAEAEHQKKIAFSIISQMDSISKLIEHLTSFFLTIQKDSLSVPELTQHSKLVQNVLKYVHENYADSNLSLKTIAASMQVNPAYLGREFTLATGNYFNDYINNLRIKKAIQLLTTTNIKATKIAESVGFTNSSYFFTIFKKITGQSPNDYRSSFQK